VSRFLLGIGIGTTSRSNLLSLRRDQGLFSAGQSKFKLVDSMNDIMISSLDAKSVAKFLSISTSQLGQDLIAFLVSDCKREGFFVEFGATNGQDLSNTFILEKLFDWRGILAEPARSWHQDLRKNRECEIETDCVWSESNVKLVFNEVPNLELSTIDAFSSGDMHEAVRKSGSKYHVDTITLFDLLEKFNAPSVIDYISIDTEGSEFEILKEFDFEKYRFNFISCEHNFTQTREPIFKLLTDNGYKRVLEEVSGFDDWYIHQSLFEAKGFI
jgi:FkbM family methyltransferase